MKLTRLQKIINETVREQLSAMDNQNPEQVNLDAEIGTPPEEGVEVPRYDERLAEVENYFYYIREHLQADNFDMAKSFIDRLKAKITEMEKKAYAMKQSGQV